MAQGWGLALSYPYLRINTSLPVFPHSSRISLLSLLALREASPHRVVAIFLFRDSGPFLSG